MSLQEPYFASQGGVVATVTFLRILPAYRTV